AEAVRRVARKKKVPLIDYQAEVLKRRPDDWDGALPQFKDVPGSEYEVPTLIARDGVHPSNPKAHQDFSADSLSKTDYALRNALTLRAYAEVIHLVLKPEGKTGADLLEAATFYASFDEAVRGDVGGGELTLGTRFNVEKRPGEFVFEKGFDPR